MKESAILQSSFNLDSEVAGAIRGTYDRLCQEDISGCSSQTIDTLEIGVDVPALCAKVAESDSLFRW